MTLPNVAAVIVHHRSYDTLPGTVDRLLAEGVLPANLVVIDNSEEPDKADKLKLSLPAAVNLVFTSNSGYGAAVNLGVRWHAQNTKQTDFLLVSTHESLPEPGAVHELQIALQGCTDAAVVGPALVTGVDSETVWSAGGYFSRVLGLPRHRQHKASRTELQSDGHQTVEWVDGAFLMFRRSVVEEHPIDESFFLYMEETDHQQGLRRIGWRVIIQPSSVVWQSSGGVPPYYQTRNIQLFQRKNGSRLQRLASVPFIVSYSVVRDVIKRRGTSQWGPLISGWRAGAALKGEMVSGQPPVIDIVNPLGGALSHYTKALETLLRASGVQVRVHSIDEPSVSGRGRVRWLLDYMELLVKVRRLGHGGQPTQKLVTWPVAGFVDLILVRAICGKSSAVVYHDPKPLVRSIGNGRAVARLASLFPSRPRVIVHSTAAEDAMRELGFGADLEILGHPMLSPERREPAPRLAEGRRHAIRVLGQFKQDRDLDVLQTLATQFSAECDLEIAGRGWPAVDGWKVDSRFVTEQELDELVRSSDVIVIPYKRFYQSGIAMRALEAGTPIVGRAATSLADLYGATSPLLVTEPMNGNVPGQSWSAALDHAIGHGKQEAYEAASVMFQSVVSDWQGWAVKSQVSTRRKYQS
ncbi:hypothetical protein [Arthrobacter oryzae]|uniref:glycosyltransferase n=1 Tax=Arthrobacter oryzae TaxID=409290 RepID=UPI002865CE1D|nr:hypothetical protein [Arthrobacter oryzae]MDR6505101.1 GT2 family glycosyltransferase [Arthrobacter oryzae]